MASDYYTYCCAAMSRSINDADMPLVYDKKFREYGIQYSDDLVSIQPISYCPWCGSRLPDSLRDEWFAELERLGLEPGDALPVELGSDAWWRNR